MSLPTAWSGRCSPGGATIVRQLPGGAGLRERHLAEAALELAGLVVGADDVEGEVLEDPEPDAVAGRLAQFWQPRPSSTASAARANRSRWNARSTTVATHQPVIGSLRSSNRPAAIALRPRSSGGAEASAREGAAAKAASGARSTDAVVGAAVRASRARGRSRSRSTPGIPHGSMRSKSARSTVTLRAMP